MTELHDRINRLADEARDAAEPVADEAQEESKAAVVELHQIARTAGADPADASEITEPILKLLE